MPCSSMKRLLAYRQEWHQRTQTKFALTFWHADKHKGLIPGQKTFLVNHADDACDEEMRAENV